MLDEALPELGTKLTIKGKLYKVTGYIAVLPETLVILDPLEPTLITKRLRVRASELQEYITRSLG